MARLNVWLWLDNYSIRKKIEQNITWLDAIFILWEIYKIEKLISKHSKTANVQIESDVKMPRFASIQDSSRQCCFPKRKQSHRTETTNNLLSIICSMIPFFFRVNCTLCTASRCKNVNKTNSDSQTRGLQSLTFVLRPCEFARKSFP